MKITLILLITLLSINFVRNNNGDDQVFQESALEDLRENEFEDTICNKELLLDFNLNGYSSVQQETHQFCPYVNLNCCTGKDQNYQMFMWNTQQKQLFETKIQRYIKAVKYLFGFVEQVNSYAKYTDSSQDQICQSVSNQIKKMKLTPSLVQQIVDKIYVTKQKVSDLRKGFQCVLCDGKTYMSLFEEQDIQKKSTIKVSINFCQDLVRETVETSYIRLNYFIKYLESFSIFHQCKNYLSVDESIRFRESLERREVTNQCMAFKDKDFNTYCMKYCDEFSFNRENTLIDGGFGSLIPFLEFFIQQRQYFNHQNDHVFYSNLSQIEREIKNDIKLYQDDFYIKSASGTTTVKTETQFTGGIDNYEQIQENTFFYALSNSKIILTGILLFVIFNQINDYNLK